MSKKMLKRSLALGALMAFVITGSAMAAETEVVKLGADDYAVTEGVHTVNGKVYANTGNYTYVPGQYPTQNEGAVKADKNHIYLNTDLNGYKLYVDAKNNNNKWFDGNGMTTGTQWGQRVINIYDSSAEKTGDLEIVASGAGIYGVGNIDVDELIVNAQGNAIDCSIDAGAQYDDETLEIMANTIVLTSHSGNGIQANSSVKIGKSETERVGNLTINAADRPLRLAYGDKLDIYADTLNITKAKREIKVDNAGNENGTGTSTMTIFANSGEIESDIIAGTDSSKGAVNLTFGSNVNWIGAISTGANASVGALDLSGTWNLTKASSLTNAAFNAGSKLVINGNSFKYNDAENATNTYALNAVGTGASLTVQNDAKIVINNGVEEGIYNIAKGFAKGVGENWTLEAENALWYADWANVDGADDTLHATIKVKTAEDMVNTGVATNENKDILLDVAAATDSENPTATAINDLASNDNVSNEDIQKGAAALLQIAEAGGFTGNVVSVGKQINGVVGARNSFAGPKHGGPRHRGGHGPSIADENNGSAIWAQYVHGKDKVDGIDMGGVENAYESQFNGVVLGADFKQVGSYASGIAFNYGEGDSHSKKNVVQSDSEFDFWGVSYYGAVKKQDTNFIFDIGYSESDSDVEQVVGGNTITANPEASTWSAGVKVEKLIDKGAVQIVPYAGLRYMSIDTDDYKATGSTDEATFYSTERQDIWLLPIGVSLSQENVYDSGWIVTPKADLSYTWAMGDTDSSMTVNMPGVGSDKLGYTVMDDGSFMATVGLDAQKEDWTFGVAYSYQKGDSTRSDRWYVNARYSF